MITELKLWEISLVTFPSNQYSRVTDIKKDDSQEIIKTLQKSYKTLEKMTH